MLTINHSLRKLAALLFGGTILLYPPTISTYTKEEILQSIKRIVVDTNYKIKKGTHFGKLQ